MRIACVFEHPTLNGGERSMLGVIRALRGDEFHFHAFAPGSGRLWNALQECGVPCTAFERLREPVGATGPAERTAEALAKLVDADLIHGNSLSTAQFTGLAAGRIGIPAVSHVREIERLNPTRRRRIEANRYLVAVSNAVAEHLGKEGVPDDQIVTIHNGVDVDGLSRDRFTGTIRQELGIARTAPVIATIGQVSLRKATEVFLEATAALAPRYPDLHALVVGTRFSRKPESQRFEAALHERVAQEGLEDRVHFLGWRDDVPGILVDLDLLVHAARQEPLGRVLIEAAALGAPCVATAVGGTAEIIDDGVSGWLVPPNEAVALADKIGWALDRPAALQAAGTATRELAVARFAVEKCAARTAALYRSTKAP